MDGSKTTAHEAQPVHKLKCDIPTTDAEKGRATAAFQGLSTPRGSESLTVAYSQFTRRRCHFRVIAGLPIKRTMVARRAGHLRVRHDFLPGSRFILDLWRRNDYGTTQWRCFVCEAVAPGELAQRIPHVAPGGRVLMSTRGVAQSKVFLAWLYDLKTQGVDLLNCPREMFEAAHFRLAGNELKGMPLQRLSGAL